MLKKLLGRHRSLRIGASILGVSALAIGVASPAFAAQNVNNGNADNANAQNDLIVESGAAVSYQLMLAESNIFNQAPGCDLISVSGSEQPLDFGCPGLNGEAGVTQAPAQTTSFTDVTVTSGSKKVKVSSAPGLEVGDQLTDSQGVIPVADPITSVKSSGKLKLEFAAKGNSTGAGDTITVNTVPQQGEDGYTTLGLTRTRSTTSSSRSRRTVRATASSSSRARAAPALSAIPPTWTTLLGSARSRWPPVDIARLVAARSEADLQR